MFYSIFSNNCQHFILDLCEHIDLLPKDTHGPMDPASNDVIAAELETDHEQVTETKRDVNI